MPRNKSAAAGDEAAAAAKIYYWEIDWWRRQNGYLGENVLLLEDKVYTRLSLSDDNKDNFFNDTTIDNAINAGLVSPQIYEIRRRLFDKSEGFKLWRELGMSISNTIKSVLNGVIWNRSIIEQGKNLGYASIDGQCRDGMKDQKRYEKTCEYCGYSEDAESIRKFSLKFSTTDERRKNVIFSCEHVLEVGLLWMFLGISFSTNNNKDHEGLVKNLYHNNYRMACCRCNFIKADIQVNKSIVPESASGAPTIFVGWNPVGRRFYVNMVAVKEFARLVMCFSMRTTGAAGKGHIHILDHLSRTSTTVNDGIDKISKRTAACVKGCVDHMNKMIFELSDREETNRVKKAFNPSIVRFAAYKTVYDHKMPKAEAATGGSKGKGTDINVEWFKNNVNALTNFFGTNVNYRMFDNSIKTAEDKTVDKQRRNKVRFMFILNELLKNSTEFGIYTNIANIYSLYNSSNFNHTPTDNSKPYTRSDAKLHLQSKGSVNPNEYKSIVIKDINDTESYVNSAFRDDTHIVELKKYIRHNVQNLSSVLGSIGSNLASDDNLSLYIDIWNILNEHITRTHKIFLELIKIENDANFHRYIIGDSNVTADRFIKLLKVVRFCIGKGLCIILDNINRHCPDLVEYNEYNETFNFLFYELDSLIDSNSISTDFQSYSTAILTANQHIKPIFGIYINSKGVLNRTAPDQNFPILILELPTTVSNVAITKQITKQVRWNTDPHFPDRSGTRDGSVIDGTAAAEDNAEADEAAAAAAAEAKAEADEAASDFNKQSVSKGEENVNKYNSDLQKILVSILAESRKSRGLNIFSIRGAAAAAAAASGAAAAAWLYSNSGQKGGSNFENKLITGIGSMLRNEVTNKSKYNISTKRLKMNKKTRKNVFSLLEKRRKHTIAKKHRKNKTLRKK